MFTMENCFYLLISQAMRYLRDPAVHPRDKQRMKQELSSELVLRGGGGGAGGQVPVLGRGTLGLIQVFFSRRARCSPASHATSAGEPPAPLLLASSLRLRASPPLSPRPAPRVRSL